MNETIWAIPGFLGLPSDWDFLKWKNIVGVDLHAFGWNSLTAWAKQFNDWIAKQNKDPAILMGYSLGGRLALHVLLDRPQQWKAAIIISTHPGLTDSQEKQKRFEHDQKWVERFQTEKWESLMESWNAQDVFKQDVFHFDRLEANYQRPQIIKTLFQGSLLKQADLRQHIANCSMPILWITGSLDQRYCQLAQSLIFAHFLSRWEKIADAGHRVPWTQSHLFSQCVQTFLQKIRALPIEDMSYSDNAIL